MRDDVAAAARRATQAAQRLDAATAELADRVRAAHRDGTSQAELARRTGRHRNTIAAWCRG